MFWADITKYIRSVLFKKELESGNFKVKQAVESDNGENISDFFDNSKNHINEMVAAMRYMGTTEQTGSALSSSNAEFGGYLATILFNVDTDRYSGFEILSHSGFEGNPSLRIGIGKVEVFGHSEVARRECTATIRYTIKISDFD
jgi:hypothetical protein